MSNSKEISTLYRTFSPTLNAYEHDGSGRDSYISYNCGGYWKTRIPPGTPLESSGGLCTRYRWRCPSHDVAPFRYYSDGSGRDSYILINSGGLKRQYKPLSSYHLKDFLRAPEDNFFTCNLPPCPRIGKKFYVSRDEYRNNQILRKNQNGIIERLYIKEKHKFIPQT